MVTTTLHLLLDVVDHHHHHLPHQFSIPIMTMMDISEEKYKGKITYQNLQTEKVEYSHCLSIQNLCFDKNLYVLI